MASHRQDRDTERGALTVAVAVTMAIVILAFAMAVTLRMASAGDDAGKIRNGADAAALAGAQAIQRDLPAQLANWLLDEPFQPCGLGQDAAADFASRNKTELVSYCYYPESDRIEVTVRSTEPTETGKPEEFRATAEIGRRLGPCHIPDIPLPTPTPTPTSSTPSESPSGSPSSKPKPTTSSPKPTPTAEEVVAKCGDLEIPVNVLPGGKGDPTFGDLSFVRDLLEPRLIG